MTILLLLSSLALGLLLWSRRGSALDRAARGASGRPAPSPASASAWPPRTARWEELLAQINGLLEGPGAGDPALREQEGEPPPADRQRLP